MNIDESKTPKESVSVVAVPNKGGRPSKYTPEAIEKLLRAIADGLTIRQSCVAAGIGEQTLRDWQERYPDLGPRLAEAREQARQKALAGIKAAGEAGDWRALECFLKMSFQDYRDKGTHVQVNTGSQIICDEETRQRIMALRKEILGEPKKAEAIEVEIQPSGLLAPIETSAEPFKPAKPESEAELALREKKIQEESSWQQQEPECYIEPSGADHPALRHLGLGPK